MDIALGIESAGHPFIWVVRKGQDEGEKWLPEGFEERMKGLIIRGWAPQRMILEHQAVGAFVTQCGTNSIFESAAAGVPMITCPVASEQFYNEKVVTQLWKVGVEAGKKIYGRLYEETEAGMKRENLEKAVRQVMGGCEEAAQMRKRAKEVMMVIKKAVEEGGSCYNNMTALIKDLENCRNLKIGSTQD